jgi:hypothetical protein
MNEVNPGAKAVRDQLIFNLMRSVPRKKTIPKDLPEFDADAPGWNILLQTGYKWKAINPKSSSREFKNLASAALIEYEQRKQYRQQLLDTTSYGHLRQDLEGIMSQSAMPSVVNGLTTQKWAFWDSSTLSLPEKLPVPWTKQRGTAWTRPGTQTLFEKQQDAIQKLVDVIQ